MNSSINVDYVFNQKKQEVWNAKNPLTRTEHLYNNEYVYIYNNIQ